MGGDGPRWGGDGSRWGEMAPSGEAMALGGRRWLQAGRRPVSRWWSRAEQSPMVMVEQAQVLMLEVEASAGGGVGKSTRSILGTFQERPEETCIPGTLVSTGSVGAAAQCYISVCAPVCAARC